VTLLSDFGARPAWWRLSRSLLGLAALTFGVLTDPPAGGWHGMPLAVLVVCLPICIAGWLVWLFGRAGGRVAHAGVVLVAAAGLVLAIVQPTGVALVFVAVACAVAGANWLPRWSGPYAVGLSAVFVAARIATHGWSIWLLVGPGAFAFGLLIGLMRRQGARLAEETVLAREERARAAALGERARLAREIHDVLAHTLSALSVQLETADALLESDLTERARQSVARASRLAREGLAETRRAIGALRGDTPPLTEMLDQLAGGYRTDLDAPASVIVDGQPRALDPDATLALYRTAQEAMTNVRKHAPGAPVTVRLIYHPDDVSLSVDNGAAPVAVPRPLADSGGGYGLTGLRERAELCGGVLTAQPSADGYRVEIRLAR
jgi:signal transduction histidine kinase